LIIYDKQGEYVTEIILFVTMCVEFVYNMA